MITLFDLACRSLAQAAEALYDFAQRQRRRRHRHRYRLATLDTRLTLRACSYATFAQGRRVRSYMKAVHFAHTACPGLGSYPGSLSVN